MSNRGILFLKIKVLIAVDHQLFAEGLISLLKNFPDIVVIGNAIDGKQLLHILNHKLPDIILTDIDLPLTDGVEVAKRILRKFTTVKIILLSKFYHESLAAELKLIGVQGYLLKSISAEQLVMALREVVQGGVVYCDPCTFQNHNYEILEDDFAKKYKLTKRELEILSLIRNEYTSAKIALQLNISIFTVDTHRKNIVHKIGSKTVAAMVRFALEHNV
jgi:DNA-binding NarL/FixJ family response regulator